MPGLQSHSSRRLYLWGALLLATTLGCKDPDADTFSGGGNTETKPDASLLKTISATSGLGAGGTGGGQAAVAAADVTYELKVTTSSGAQLCTGETEVAIMSDFSLKFPAAKVQCVSLSIDLASLLGANIGFGNTGSNQDPNLSSDGKVLSIHQIGGATFTPPRPFLLGPIVQNAALYQGFSRNSQHQLSGHDNATNADYHTQGSFQINVLKVGTTYSNNYVGQAFNNILQWQMTSSGFAGAPASFGITYQKVEWLWNVQPLMIPRIAITGNLSDFIASTGNASGGGAGPGQLTGILTVELLVKKYNIAP